MKQVFTFGGQTVINGRRSWIQGFGGVTTAGAGNRNAVFPEAGTLGPFTCNVDLAPGAGQTTSVDVEINDVISTLGVQFAGAGAPVPLTDAGTIAVAAGDRVCIRVTTSGGSAGANNMWGAMVFEPSTANRAVMLAANNQVWNNATCFLDTLQDEGVLTTAAIGGTPWGVGGVLDKLYVNLSGAPGAGRSRTFQFNVNGVSSGPTFTISNAATTGNMSGAGVAFSARDLVCVAATGAGGPALTGWRYGISYAPTVDGEWNISGRLDTDYATGQFFGLPNALALATGTEALRYVMGQLATPAFDYIIRDPYLNLATAPGAGNSRTLTLRANAAATPVTVTVSGTNLSASGTGEYLVTAADRLTMLGTKTAGAVGNIRHKYTFGAAPPATARLRMLTGVGL